MSRLKVGLDYFPFDVNFFEDIKVLALKGKYGYEGIVVYQRLLCRIYGDKYYYILWDDIYVEALAGFLNISLELLQAIVDKCLKLQLFDANMYSQYKILTSHGIQSRYLKAITATKKVSIKNMLPLEFIPR